MIDSNLIDNNENKKCFSCGTGCIILTILNVLICACFAISGLWVLGIVCPLIYILPIGTFVAAVTTGITGLASKIKTSKDKRTCIIGLCIEGFLLLCVIVVYILFKTNVLTIAFM